MKEGKGRKRAVAVLLTAAMTMSCVTGAMSGVAAEEADTKIVNCKVDYQENPIGIAAEDVKFSWAMESDVIGAAQASWQIRVTKDSEDGELVWDSGEVADSESVAIGYEGAELEVGTRYYWTVTITDQDGNVVTSEPAYFEIAGDISDAQWIMAGDEDTSAPLFRAELSLDGEIASARLYISAMGIYEASINGREVQGETDDIFNPGYTNFDTNVNYQTYDVTEYLQTGENAIGVAVGGGWYQTSYASDYSASFGPDDEKTERALLAKLVVEFTDGTTQVLTTNEEDWSVTLNSPYLEDDFYNGETYDANIAVELEGWDEPGYEEGDDWESVTVVEYAGSVNPNAKAEARIEDSYEQTPVYAYTYNESENIEGTGTSEGLTYGSVVRHEADPGEDIELKAGDVLILDMGQNMVGVTDTVLSGEQGTVVTFRYAEALNDGRDEDYVSEEENGSMGSDGPEGTLYRIALRSAECTDYYTMSGADSEEYQPTFTYRGFRYVEISATEDIVIHSVRGRVITSVGEATGSLETSNEEVNQLISNVFWSEMGNYLSIPMDCPQRNERAGWTGDAQLFAQTAMLNFDVQAFLENYIEIMNDFAESNGDIYGSVMPANQMATKNCGWSDAGIIIPWVVYLQTGDTSLIEEYYDQMDLYMSAEDPTMAGETGYNSILYGDWLAYCGTTLGCMNSLYQIYMTQLMEKMAVLIGNEEKAAEYAESYETLKEAFLDKYTDEEGNLLTLSVDGADSYLSFATPKLSMDNAQTGLLWALKLGLYRDDEMKETMVQNLVANIINENEEIREGQAENTLAVGFLGVNVILPVLTDLGYGDLAYTLLLQTEDPSWLYAVENGATTTWERWNSYSVETGYGDSSMNSFNHYSYGACVEWMYNYMSGIKSDENNPGYKHFILQPTVDTEGRIDYVNGSYESNYGLIVSNWTSENGSLSTYTAVVPANTSATLYLPISSVQAEALEVPEGAEYIGMETHNGVECAVYELQAGSYSFVL